MLRLHRIVPDVLQTLTFMSLQYIYESLMIRPPSIRHVTLMRTGMVYILPALLPFFTVVGFLVSRSIKFPIIWQSKDNHYGDFQIRFGYFQDGERDV